MYDDRPRAIVGVHGIGNYDSEQASEDAAEALSKVWTEALSARLGCERRVDVRVAYYADRLRGEVSQGSAAIEGTAGAREVLVGWARALGMPVEQSQGRLTMPVRYVVDWIARRYGLNHRLVQVFVTRFCREVATYFADDHARATARGEVRRAILRHQPSVVIAHSLGSVVAYEALSDASLPTVDLLVTLGSPLGLPDVVFDRLTPPPTGGFGVRPASVHRWINIADPGDIVAVPLVLSDRFQGVNADLRASIDVFDFHRVVRYLRNSVTASVVAPYVDMGVPSTDG